MYTLRVVRLFLVLAALSICVMTPTCGGFIDSSTLVTFNFSSTMPFLGSGAFYWSNTRPTDNPGAMLSDINAKFVRTQLWPALPASPLKSGQTVEQWLKVINATNLNTKTQINFIKTQQDFLFNQHNICPHQINWAFPPEWSTPYKDGSAADPTHFQDYCNVITASLLLMKNYSYVPCAIELTNEPGDASCSFINSTNWVNLAQMMRTTLDRYGLQQILIEGAGLAVGQTAWADAIAALPGGGNTIVGVTAHHVYWTTAQLQANTIPFRPDLRIYSYATEYGNHGATSGYPITDPLESDLESNDYGLAVAMKTLVLMSQNVNGFIFWELQDQSFSKDPHGLLRLDGTRRPVANVLQALFQTLPQGTVMTAGKSTIPQVVGANTVFEAFYDVKTATANVIAVNYYNTTVPFHCSLFSLASVEPRMTQTYNFQNAASILSISMFPADSINTIRIQQGFVTGNWTRSGVVNIKIKVMNPPK